jgi:replicative DNA helicase
MEQGVLGCCLISPNECLTECVEKLKAGKEVFYDLRHQEIFETMVAMFDARQPIELVTLQQNLKDRQLLGQVGGISYLSELQDSVPSAANLSYYLDVVKEKFLLRKMIQTCSGVVGRIYDYEGDVDTLMDELERTILSIRVVPSVSRSIRDLLNDAMPQIEARAQDWSKIFGLSTGLADLDQMTDGIHSGEFIVIAAPTSCGKTALALQICLDNALNGVPVGFLSAEMQAVKLAIRTVANKARVNMRRLSEPDLMTMTPVMASIAKAPIYLETINGYTIGQVRARARRMKQQYGIKILGVENIQLLTGDGDTREQEVASISRGLKDMALELDIAVIGLSQLNDDGKMRESRAIGHDADSAWIIANNGEWQPKIQPVILKVQKSRDGETGDVPLTFIKENTRFEQFSNFDDVANQSADNEEQPKRKWHRKPYKN